MNNHDAGVVGVEINSFLLTEGLTEGQLKCFDGYGLVSGRFQLNILFQIMHNSIFQSFCLLTLNQ